jgi:SAM-dependent methyltransferase
MKEIRSGLFKVLEIHWVYDLFQDFVGANKWRSNWINEQINPFLRPDSMVLDVGCGTGEIILYLNPVKKYLGVDRNAGYIKKALNRLNNKNIFFKCLDLNDNKCKVELNGEWDAILMVGLLHHMSDEEGENLIKVLTELMNINTTLFILEPIYTNRQSKLSRYIVSKDRGRNVRELSGYLRLLQDFSEIKHEIDLHPIRIPYAGVMFQCKL